MGILSGALAVFAMREMRDNAMEKSTSSFYGIAASSGAGGGISEMMQRKVTFFPAAASSTVDHSRGRRSIDDSTEEPQEVKTSTAATGLIETTF